MFLISAAIIFGIYLAKIVWQWHQTNKKLQEIFQVAPGLPILGIALNLLDPKQVFSYSVKLVDQCKNTSFVGYLGPKPVVAIVDPELAEVILSSNVLLDKPDEYQYFSTWFGNGLLLATGQTWRNKRKILTPSFHYKILENFVEVFDQKSKVLVEKLKKESNGLAFDIYNYITLCTFDIICETAMGTALNCQENPDNEFLTSNKNMCHMMYLRSSTHLRFNLFYKLSKWSRIERESIKILRSYSKKVIDNRRKVLEQNADEREDDVDQFGAKVRKSFLDVLLKATIDGKPLTDKEICEEVDMFMFEGHDTTASALSFTIYLLGQHRDIQQKVYEEIVEVLGSDKKASVNYEQLQSLKYTEMVIKECLRLFPSVVGFGRKLCQDVPYKNGVIPKGVAVILSAYNLHRNKAEFPDPEKFDPERFNIENSAGRHPYAYVPFSAGPRNCIGQRFAMLEVKCVISKILQNYEIIPAPNFKICPIPKVTLQSANGFKVQIVGRD